MKMKCALGLHEWHGCNCSKCGKARDEGHEWANDCGKCATCGKVRQVAHIWGGCKCLNCGKTRDEGHNWGGCKCSGCGKTRDEGHKWDGCQCSGCGKIELSRTLKFTWTPTCGENEHDWSNGFRKCAKCGESGYNFCLAAMKKDNLEIVESFLRLGMDPLQSYWTDGYKDTSGLFESAGKGGGPDLDRPLIYAIAYDRLAAVKLMERYRLSLQRRFEGQSLLVLATQYGSKKVAEHLIGADVNLVCSKDGDGRTPLHYAACGSRTDIVELLLASKGEVNAKCNRGYTPLHLAAANGCKAVAELLLANQADVNARANDDATPLHEAQSMKNGELAELLRQHGGHE